MDKQQLVTLHTAFEDCAYENDSVEYWFARDLLERLGYARWENFIKVIEKAKTACQTAGATVTDHFRDVTKMVKIGSGAERETDDITLTRYACYLIAQNGDPKKEQIAFAMTYFAVQTRKIELIEQRLNEWERLQARNQLKESNKQLSGVLFEHGVDSKTFATIKSKGDQALFGGNSTAMMKKRLAIPEKRPLDDFLPTITLKAKDFANEITSFNVKKDNLRTETKITNEHVKNNSEVRKLLLQRGIRPEELPAEDDIQKLERQLKQDEKKLLTSPPLVSEDE
ncbi:MAG: DNA damage-inducible protein D [Vampirovibrionales bacterium]|nr:DNA damage-inducible protein D [Vampirovibrionales bacterium]